MSAALVSLVLLVLLALSVFALVRFWVIQEDERDAVD